MTIRFCLSYSTFVLALPHTSARQNSPPILWVDPRAGALPKRSNLLCIRHLALGIQHNKHRHSGLIMSGCQVTDTIHVESNRVAGCNLQNPFCHGADFRIPAKVERGTTVGGG